MKAISTIRLVVAATLLIVGVGLTSHCVVADGVVGSAEASGVFGGGCTGNEKGPNCGGGTKCDTDVPGFQSAAGSGSSFDDNPCGGTCTFKDPNDCIAG